jgi:hypothetical protein
VEDFMSSSAEHKAFLLLFFCVCLEYGAHNCRGAMNEKTVVTSPCIGHCKLDPQDVCEGCFRSIQGILAWRDASNDKRLEINKQALQRRKIFKATQTPSQ